MICIKGNNSFSCIGQIHEKSDIYDICIAKFKTSLSGIRFFKIIILGGLDGQGHLFFFTYKSLSEGELETC